MKETQSPDVLRFYRLPEVKKKKRKKSELPEVSRLRFRGKNSQIGQTSVWLKPLIVR